MTASPPIAPPKPYSSPAVTAPPPVSRRKLPVVAPPHASNGAGEPPNDKVDVGNLYRELTHSIAGEVRFDREALGLYATDSSNFRQVPIGVVIPRTLDDVVQAHRICSRWGAPILNRGGGTSLSGETVNFAVVLDHSKYLRGMGEPDAERRLLRVESGAVNQQVNAKAGTAGLAFGPDPSSHGYCTIGGNIGNNSCGIHSVQAQLYGPGPRTSDNLHSMKVVTYDGAVFEVGVGEEAELGRIVAEGGRKGEIYAQLRDLRDRYADQIRERFPSVEELPRRVSGYNLDELLPERGFNVARALVGTEGTCATVLEATLMLTPELHERTTVVVAYSDICQAADDVEAILKWKPIGLEGIDRLLFEHEQAQNLNPEALKELPQQGNHAWLLVQFGAETVDEVQDLAQRFSDWLREVRGYAGERITTYDSQQAGGDAEALWKIREAGLGATAFPPGGKDHWPGWEDSAVPPGKTGPYLRDLKALYRKYGLQGAMYGHLGQGCVHSRISFDLKTAQGVRRYRAFLNEAADLVVSYGGSLSGEHGDGQQRAEFLEKQYGPELLSAMREFKRIWDPQGKMNPGKVVDAYRVDENLKLGPNYQPARVDVQFAYPEDGGDFSHATLRCVGVGKCRQPAGVDVMCPSYIVTREEKHSTRGRARLLFEMLQGEVIRDGWQSREVYDALELCLSCKGCTSDCPVHVDMPTYKSEFLHHHFRSLRRNRSRHMYAFGFVDQVARLGSLAPELANWVTHTPGLSWLVKRAAGMDSRRSVPAFAPSSLQSWFARRGGSQNPSGPSVLLWPDTFNNYFHTQVGVACVEALEQAGFRVMMPRRHVCCGRPLYDYGFLNVARRYLDRTLSELRDVIRSGTPVVGMEPSCLAVFKNELTNLLPHDQDARRLAGNCYHFSEFLESQADSASLPRLPGRSALLWGHCHHKATGGIAPERRLLEQGMGLSVTEAKGGCCGLAGSWGFEQGKYETSMQCGEVGWLPAVRKADRNTLIIADGFSCKTQLEQSGAERRALHCAEVIQLSHQHGPNGLHGPRPERLAAPPPSAPLALRAARTGLALALLGATTWAGLLAARWARRKWLTA